MTDKKYEKLLKRAEALIELTERSNFIVSGNVICMNLCSLPAHQDLKACIKDCLRPSREEIACFIESEIDTIMDYDLKEHIKWAIEELRKQED